MCSLHTATAVRSTVRSAVRSTGSAVVSAIIGTIVSATVSVIIRELRGNYCEVVGAILIATEVHIVWVFIGAIL